MKILDYETPPADETWGRFYVRHRRLIMICIVLWSIALLMVGFAFCYPRDLPSHAPPYSW